MKVLIDHTTNHTNFLSYAIWNISWFTMILQNKSSVLDADLPEFYIYNTTSYPNTFEEIAQRMSDVSFKVINTAEREFMFQNMNDTVLHLESTMILPRIVYLSNCDLPEDIRDKNLCLPLVTYKSVSYTHLTLQTIYSV